MTRLFRSACLASAAALGAASLAACGEPAPDDADTGAAQAGADAARSAGSAGDASGDPGAELTDAAASGDPVAAARACRLEGAEPPEPFIADDQPEDMSDAAYNQSVARSFLEYNEAAPCVYTLQSGLQFRIEEPVREADAPSPQSGELVAVHYEGRLVDGTIFDTSYGGDPAVFPSDRLIQGWVQALPLMRVGETWTLYVPPRLAYGQQGTPGGPIGPNEALIFTVELVGLPGRDGDDGR